HKMWQGWYGHSGISRVMPSGIGMTRYATAAHVLCKGRVSRLATSQELPTLSSQFVIMASPSPNVVLASCAAATVGACRARSGGASMVMPTSGRPVIATMHPVVATHTRLRDHQAKSPRRCSLGLSREHYPSRMCCHAVLV